MDINFHPLHQPEINSFIIIIHISVSAKCFNKLFSTLSLRHILMIHTTVIYGDKNFAEKYIDTYHQS